MTPAIVGVLPCRTCRVPHDAFEVNDRPLLPPQWAKGNDGHSYRPIGDPEFVLTRLIERGAITQAQVLEALA